MARADKKAPNGPQNRSDVAELQRLEQDRQGSTTFGIEVYNTFLAGGWLLVAIPAGPPIASVRDSAKETGVAANIGLWLGASDAYTLNTKRWAESSFSNPHGPT